MTPQLFDPNNPIKWRDLPFEELIKLAEGRINFHIYRHQHKIPGYDRDDIRQELIFALWNKLEKIPADMENFDYRFLRYIDTIFFREATNLWRKHVIKRPNEVIYRDELNRSVPMIDNFDEIWDE